MTPVVIIQGLNYNLVIEYISFRHKFLLRADILPSVCICSIFVAIFINALNNLFITYQYLTFSLFQDLLEKIFW